LGTPAYISPEAVTDPATTGPAADLYSLGATGYFLLTGRRVFEAKTGVEMCIQHVTATPVRPSEACSNYVPAALEAILLRCLAKRPTDRFASASDLAAALRAVPSRDWDDSEAHRWWTEFRRNETEAAVTSTTP